MNNPFRFDPVGLLGRRASLAQCFGMIALVACAPLALVTAALWREVNGDLHHLHRERAGVEYMRVVWRVAHGAAIDGVVDTPRLDALDRARTHLDADMGVGQESAVLAARATASESPADIATAAQILAKRIGERAGLFADEHTGTYFHIQTMLVAAPELAAAIADANRLLGPNPPADLSPGLAFGRVKFALDNLENQARDAMLGTDDPAARAAMESAIRQLQGAKAEHERVARTWFRDRLAALGRTPARGGNTDLALRLQHQRTMEAAQAVVAPVALHLAATLDARHERRLAAAAAAIVILLAGLALLAAFLWVVTRALLRPARELLDLGAAIIAGRPAGPASFIDCANEVGDAARYVEVFRRAMAERATLTAGLEERVALRTRELEAARADAQESEQLLSQALKSVEAGVWGTDRRTGEIWSSPAVARICGKPMRGADMYDGAWDVVAPEEAIAIRAERPDPRTGVRGLNRDVRIIRPDGEERWIHCTATTTPEGRLVGLVMDVTQRKRQEIELAAARARAEAAVEAQSRFLASMSHEIRTPLNGVLAMAAAMERTPLQVDQKRMVAVMTSSGRQLLAMLDDVLDLAKIEADRLRLDLAPFDAAASVEAVAALFREAATAKGLTMWVDVAPNARGLFVGDALRVRQVLQNFVANAIKFTEAGDIAIRLTHSRGRLRFSVEDTGIGIDAAKASRLFERFAQADESITRRFGGTGLGLAIARELAHLMGGDVGVDSAPGAGATFWFEAPFAPAADCAQPPQARPARILAAEDNPANRLVLETLLRQADLSADFVENGAAAVDAARAIAYDLVLMDLHMPGMDGIEAARAIRALDGPNADIPILALTASAQPDTIAACLAAGMHGHVAKPITPATLYAAIAEALGAEPPPALAPAAAAG